VVMLVGMATALLVYGMVDINSLALRRDKNTAAALADIKLALIGYAVSDANRPGELPCPDVNNDGQLTLGIDFTGGAGSPCVSLLGRLPWKTLGLPDLRDGSGERLWYALSDNFHAGATPPLNSDTMGQLTVTGGAPATNVVAIVFSPGEVLGTQVRDAANENNVANYLEGENANGDTIFTTGTVSTTFNDRLLVITTADLMPLVEMRVARELRALLQAYRANSACGCYPWADGSLPWTGEGDNDVLRGAPSLNPGDPELWGSGSIPPLPAWFLNNQWWRVIYYAVDPSKTETPTAGTLTVNANPYDVVLIMTGPAGSGPLGNLRPSFDWTHYVDDTLNSDGNNAFVTPSSTAYARDRLYTIP